MFGVGFTELVVIMGIALLFLGPKGISKYAFWVGKMTRKLSEKTSEVTAVLRNEVQTLDQDGSLREIANDIKSIQSEFSPNRIAESAWGNLPARPAKSHSAARFTDATAPALPAPSIESDPASDGVSTPVTNPYAAWQIPQDSKNSD